MDSLPMPHQGPHPSYYISSCYCIFMDVYDRILCRRPGASLLQFDGLKSSLDLFLWIESDIQPGAVLQGNRLQEFRLVLLQQKHAISNLLAAVLHHLPSTRHLGTTYPLSCEPCLWIRWLSTWSILHTSAYYLLFVSICLQFIYSKVKHWLDPSGFIDLNCRLPSLGSNSTF